MSESERDDRFSMLERQPVPTDSRCPSCGGEPLLDREGKQAVEHRLSANGYLHDDICLECEDCGERWTCGVPQGTYEGGGDLWCSSCGESWMLVHRLSRKGDIGDDEVTLHLKCPRCFYFDKTVRAFAEDNIALMGYPPITGNVEDATTTYGYPDGDAP